MNEVWTEDLELEGKSQPLQKRQGIESDNNTDMETIYLFNKVHTATLPDEVWIIIFRYLSVSDRLTVRLTCKYFRDLLDNSALWKNLTLELKSGIKYKDHFWHMLRRWRVTSVWLATPHRWRKIFKELPGLTSLIIYNRSFTEMLDFRSFTKLEHLYLTHLSHPIDFEQFSIFMPQQLTHLTMCHEMIKTNTLPTEIPPESPFKKLKSLVFHCAHDSHPVDVLLFFLSSLPQLQHLSLEVFTDFTYKGNISDLPPLNNCSLSSLELIGCVPEALPVDLMNMLKTLPFLRSLALFYVHDYNQDNFVNLFAWLRELPALTSLVVSGGDANRFFGSFPSGLTRLTLRPQWMCPEDMGVLSAQLQNLRHLNLKVMPHAQNLDLIMTLIPQHFPKLKTLRIQSRVRSRVMFSADAFLSLASLKELEALEILDEVLPPADLVANFRAMTNNRVRIYCRPEIGLLRTCIHSEGITTDSWICQ